MQVPILFKAMENIKVSLIAAVKNESKYIGSCIESILTQEYRFPLDFEIIIADDSSSDNTYELLREAATLHNNITCIRSPTSGKCAAYNAAYAQAKGDFIFIFAGDDLLPSNSLELRLTSMVGYCKDNNIDWRSRPLAQFSKMKTTSIDPVLDNKVLPPNYVPRGNSSGATTFLNRKAAEVVFPIPQVLKAEDGWMSLCVENLIKYYHFPEITYTYRIHAHNSVPYSRDYPSYRTYLLDRMIVYQVFSDFYGNSLSRDQFEDLNRLVMFAEFFRKKSLLRLAFARVSLPLKVKCLAFSSRFIYLLIRILYKLRLITL
jgi:glycosyltransferase involved in cell wall biosynthesis